MVQNWCENKLDYKPQSSPCLLYTSDAADEEDSVDLGGRRIIKLYSWKSLNRLNLPLALWQPSDIFFSCKVKNALIDLSQTGRFYPQTPRGGEDFLGGDVPLGSWNP